MYLLLHKNIKQIFVRYLQRSLSYQDRWENKNFEVITLPEGNSDIVSGQFLFETEKYPVVIVAANGGEPQPLGIGDRICQTQTSVGQYTLQNTFLTLTDGGYVRCPVVNTGNTLGSIDSVRARFLMGRGPEAPITATIYEMSGNSYTLPVGSGSYAPRAIAQFESCVFIMEEPVILDSAKSYGVEFALLDALPTSTYYIVADTTQDRIITTLSGDVTGSLAIELESDAREVVGGNLIISLDVTAVAKDQDTSHELGELIYLYLSLIKRADISRSARSTSLMKLVKASEFTKAGIFVNGNARVNTSQRKRNTENLFLTTVSMPLSVPWREDFILPLLKEFGVQDFDSF